MRACSCLLAVGVVLVSLPAAAEPPATKAIAGDAVSGILTPFAVGPTAGLGTTASVLSGAAAAFAIETSRRERWPTRSREGWFMDNWANHRKPCGRDDDDDDDDDDDQGRRQRRKCRPHSANH